MSRSSTANSAMSVESAQQRIQEIFNSVDSDGNGQIDQEELQGALINGDYTKFHPDTVRALIRMFDRSNNGSVNQEEFSFLWRYLADWRKLFSQFDSDNSDTISIEEFQQAVRAFGYTLSAQVLQALFVHFSSTPKDQRERTMSFDMFIQACIVLKRMTNSFKIFDTDRDGVITVGFEDFVFASLRLL